MRGSSKGLGPSAKQALLLISLAAACTACGGATAATEASSEPDAGTNTPPSDAAAAADASASTAAPAPDALTPDACSDFVITPGGPIARECVQEVPNGGFVSLDDAGNSNIIVDGKIIATYGPCPCSRPQTGTPPSPCQSGGLTACVRQCGEAVDSETTASECAASGYWECPRPFVPAASCPPGSWPSNCGPWVNGYDCPCTPVCSNGAWQCICNDL